VNYQGLTYPHFLSWKLIFKLWKKIFCRKNIHLFDEVKTLDEHRLSCDACGLSVHIAYIETEEEGSERAKNGLYVDTVAFEKSEKDSKYEKVLTFPKSIAPNRESSILDKIFAKKDS